MFSDFLGYSEDAGRIQEKLKQLCFGCEGNGCRDHFQVISLNHLVFIFPEF